jgi:hypothetical protein
LREFTAPKRNFFSQKQKEEIVKQLKDFASAVLWRKKSRLVE